MLIGSMQSWVEVGDWGHGLSLNSALIDPRDYAGPRRAPDGNEMLREGSRKLNCGGRKAKNDVGKPAF